MLKGCDLQLSSKIEETETVRIPLAAILTSTVSCSLTSILYCNIQYYYECHSILLRMFQLHSHSLLFKDTPEAPQPLPSITHAQIAILHVDEKRIPAIGGRES